MRNIQDGGSLINQRPGLYQDLLEKIRASKPAPEHDLRHARHISRLYENSAAAHRRSRSVVEALKWSCGAGVHVLYYGAIQTELIEIVRVLHERIESSRHFDDQT